MVSDSEPRYRLVDSDGNVVGSLFAEADGTLKLQEGTSGSDNELAFGTDGALSVDDLAVGSSDFVSTGDFVATGPTIGMVAKRSVSFTDTTYAFDGSFHIGRVQWNQVIPADAQGAFNFACRVTPGTGESVSIRLRNDTDGENIFERTGITSDETLSRVDTFTPTSENQPITVRLEWKEDTGSNSSDIFDPLAVPGVQL